MTNRLGRLPDPTLRIATVDGDAMVEEWRHVHNAVVPPAAMSLDEARERCARYRLENAYLGDVLVGCSTVRPPEGEERVATVIARVLPPFRRRGIGTALYASGLAHARVLGAGAVETVVLAANADGLRFAEARGFAERERYVLDGESDEWVDLRLVPHPA
ncbi:GNAT family N-acetyltransferase [Streptomyces sp. NPDC053750]|uniref:GNAT family N-acetyltransferase n=1 Tax=Streptomyces sp. NPDC053750 TaxID=3365714 RepID=UPI0037D79B84